MTETKHSKHYYTYNRNMNISSNINPKMMLTKDELQLKDIRIPDYYKGKNGYEARKVVDNFDLNYNIGTAVTYLIRAENKHNTPIDCIQKAINHLEFELDKLKR